MFWLISGQSLNILQEGPATAPFFTFYDVSGASEWQTIPCQCPWPTAAIALVQAGKTKLFSSQLVPLGRGPQSLCWWCLNAGQIQIPQINLDENHV